MEVEAGTSLVVVLALMFFGSLLASALPFMFQIRGNSMKVVAGLGGGLLLGTALSIVAEEHGHAGHGHGADDWSGAILVLGFLGMMALDRSQPGHGHGCGGHAHEARPRGRPGGREGPPSPTRKPGAVDPAVLGLLVHCAADGLALGAAALSGNTQLSLIVSVAMLAHKAPMAFGLSTYLIGRGAAWREARGSLLAFAGAAPASATLTYALLSLLPGGASSPTLVARSLLASGGTFLYAATMHILPEVLAGAGPGTVAATAGGALLPALLASLGLGHAH
ncbi:Zinc transporter ZIP9 [Auxenochlorella protothecoides]|uniref:Zinc transporter ZIP9 n=1 Tax=Auxenochlorella protothecoides TaxID=3075 RepID=A0A087SNR0_AUXPR|nr:Zinc transporter ZIP9 [Auxenochlorella protothecoides]KFM27364.1 Zinc transporter ZIP9 [Auxenochlorella protothecoides]